MDERRKKNREASEEGKEGGIHLATYRRRLRCTVFGNAENMLSA